MSPGLIRQGRPVALRFTTTRWASCERAYAQEKAEYGKMALKDFAPGKALEEIFGK
jgi:hypothetical protein